MGSPDLELRDDGTLVVEAPSVESALTAVRQHCGPDATIVEAEKVQTKGLGGFFSKQLYRVHVAPTNQAGDPPETVTGASVDRGAVDAAVDVVLRRVEEGEHDPNPTFGEALHAELDARGGHESRATTPALEDVIRQREALLGEPTFDVRDHQAPRIEYEQPAPAPVPEPVVEQRPWPQPTRVPLGRPLDEWIEGSGAVLWSVDHLSRLGLPYRLIHELADLDPADDLAWVFRLAESAAMLCGPMPDVPMVVLGDDVASFAGRLGVDLAAYPDPPAYEGDAAVSVENIGRAAPFLERVLAGRPIHVMCDDTGFGVELLANAACPGPVAVVSTTRAALAVALQVVVACDGVLGFLVDEDDVTRFTPFELALAVRSQLPRS